MNDYEALFIVELGSAHVQTGRTVHRLGSVALPKPARLAIVRYADDVGCYLLYLDTTGAELTDTWHDSPVAAMEQAHWEFGSRSDEWSKSPRTDRD